MALDVPSREIEREERKSRRSTDIQTDVPPREDERQGNVKGPKTNKTDKYINY